MTGTCNLCGSTEWADMNKRSLVRCAKCSSLERTRALKLTLDRLGIPKNGDRVLHFAPERSLGTWLQQQCGDGYNPVDLEPSQYSFVKTQKFDIISDSPNLPSNHYDLILHSHVMEHIPISIGFIFHHLTRALKDDGYHIFCIPMMPGNFEEYFGSMSPEEAHKRFGQSDHVRNFGINDVDRHLGAFFRLKQHYSLYDHHTKEELDACNIPERERQGLNGSTVFVTRKSDYLLQNPPSNASAFKNIIKKASKLFRP